MIRAVVLALLLAPALAHAEDVSAYQVEGEADAGGADPRVAALDDAFAQATRSALQELVAGDVRATHKPELDKEIIGRSRLWVSKFSVTSDNTGGGRRQLAVSVRVDRDKIRARLGELGIPLIGESAAGASRGIAVLVRVTEPNTVVATYGSSANKDTPGAAALARVVHASGFAVRGMSASGPAPRGAGELPLDDDEAAAIAADAKTDAALVAGVTVGAPTTVRGVAGNAVLVTAHVRLVDKGKGTTTGSAVAAALGDDAASIDDAVERAVTAASTDVVPPPPPTLTANAFTGDDTPIGAAGVVLVRMPAKTPYAVVLAESRYLAGSRGVQSATLRRLSPSGWVIGVATDEPLDKIAQIAKKPPASGSAQVKVTGDVIEVSITP